MIIISNHIDENASETMANVMTISALQLCEYFQRTLHPAPDGMYMLFSFSLHAPEPGAFADAIAVRCRHLVACFPVGPFVMNSGLNHSAGCSSLNQSVRDTTEQKLL
jgi:hypothetical protein